MLYARVGAASPGCDEPVVYPTARSLRPPHRSHANAHRSRVRTPGEVAKGCTPRLTSIASPDIVPAPAGAPGCFACDDGIVAGAAVAARRAWSVKFQVAGTAPRVGQALLWGELVG